MNNKIYTTNFIMIKKIFYSTNKYLVNRYTRGFLRNFFINLIKISTHELSIIGDINKESLDNAYNLIDKDLDAAIQAYRLFIEENPEYFEGYSSLANALYLKGSYMEAMNILISGLHISDKKAEMKKLDRFNVRILGQNFYNIGHLSLIDLFVKLELLHELSPEKRIIYITNVSNSHYLEYWSKYIDIVKLNREDYSALRLFAKEIFEPLSCLKFSSEYKDLYTAWNVAENQWQKHKFPPLLSLNDTDKERGLEVFKQLSIPVDSWFVTLHVREGDQRITRSNSDAKINTYIEAIKTITERGGWVIRMGHPGMTPLPEMNRVIDYANSNYKTEWMDVFLWASCRFHIGTSSGPLTVPPTFGKPVLNTNCPCIAINPNIPNSLMLPKLYYSNRDERLFTFREMLEGPMGWTVSRVFPGIDCTIRDNTQEEIEAAVVEMLDLTESLNGGEVVLTTLQKQFNSLRNEFGDTGQWIISNSFLENHLELLND